ncbi:putative esterase [Halalkalibacter wakoensis JCM 9140]|uniref:Putative esterase n=1 Tax=Halalkalibacter wakoensis JCM 9140 TaxID=1236970 RepID=W4QA30_9BACI|nr:alpha/beta hydrolase family protein [Halalkalibacter wakoensis]GAE28518.1 putative esterase [Halalkalibacter wakoensis JCM 9140]
MALVNCNFFSYTLGMDYEMNVLLPEKRQQPHLANPNKKYPVLYLLHGHSDDHTSWLRKSLVELLVRDKDVIVVMPNAHRSFYTDSKHGHNYFQFLSKELPVVVSNFFPASNKREENFVAGISMGGYGAMKWALNCPEKFAAAGSLSGALSPYKSLLEADDHNMFTVSDFKENFLNVFGGEKDFQGTENDLFYIAKKLDKEDEPKPYLYQSCGVSDPLYKYNVEYRDFIENETDCFNYTYHEDEGGHDWEYWNKVFPLMLKGFGII